MIGYQCYDTSERARFAAIKGQIRCGCHFSLKIQNVDRSPDRTCLGRRIVFENGFEAVLRGKGIKAFAIEMNFFCFAFTRLHFRLEVPISGSKVVDGSKSRVNALIAENRGVEVCNVPKESGRRRSVFLGL